MRIFLLLALMVFIGCDSGSVTAERREANPEAIQETATTSEDVASDPVASSEVDERGETLPTLVEARKDHQTKIVSEGDSWGPTDVPPADAPFDLIEYPSPVGDLAAYLTKDPRDGEKHPAIVWITGGDNNSISDIWSEYPRENDQAASAFRKAGIVMMFPSQRGGNENPGQREGFYGEVEDILAATDYLEKLPYVDPDRIYLGGHSTGGTLAMLIGECTDRYQAVFALGPVSAPIEYGGRFLYCNVRDRTELQLRAPIEWMHCVQTPMFVIEGASGNWSEAKRMQDVNENEKIQFFRAPGFSHFDVIAPVAELLAKKIVEGDVQVTQEEINQLR